MSDVITGDSNTAALKGQLIVQYLQRNLIAQSKLLATVTDVTQYAQPGLSSILFPRANNFVVTKKASGTAVSAGVLTFVEDELDLNQHAVIQWLIEKKASIQSRVNLEQAALASAAAAHAKQLDVDVFAQIIQAAAGNTHAWGSTTLALTDILEARYLLDMQEVPDENRYCAVNPAEEQAMLALPNFLNASQYGGNAPLLNGEIGRIFNMPVIKTTVVTAGSVCVYHKEGVVFGMQSAPSYETESSLANLAMRYSVDQLYGTKVMYGGLMAAVVSKAS